MVVEVCNNGIDLLQAAQIEAVRGNNANADQGTHYHTCLATGKNTSITQ